MTWFREHIRNGAKLALFALAVQIVLSLGHVYLHGAHAEGVAGLATSVHADAGHDDDHHHHHGPGFRCDINAVAAMAATALPSAPPALLLPHVTVFAFEPVKAEFDHLDSISGAQHARGPPTI